MAGNFKINVSKFGDCVCLKLKGEFDGSSACELLNLLDDGKLSGNSKILVDTDSLKHIHPFGLDVLHGGLNKNKLKEVSLVFTGKKSARFASR
jgi:anti-anti-sigma regulatory factor